MYATQSRGVARIDNATDVVQYNPHLDIPLIFTTTSNFELPIHPYINSRYYAMWEAQGLKLSVVSDRCSAQ
jgi:hypothetical protein